MTAQDITNYIAERGRSIGRADLARLNLMMIDLPLEEVSDVRGWAYEGIGLIVSDPLYEGDIELADLN